MATEGNRGTAQDDSRTPISTAFGQHIRQSRLRLGVSQEELAARAHLDRTFVGRVERGEFRISLENAAALAQACGEPLWQILQRIGE
ncbi:helix-turn-helix transcriptional regulator [Deinococcus sp. HMF7604]|uniref:helix-turn-helix domain-containing protein n=1 Tax=Deinococcus betulae TaxID=2873312 RepID=UPI001CCC4CEB|nr:helix-turn-helix transcriptional regulator [Deinococcus betulae]MBZ9752494.1 helix-turn-helix transcriptional regulator [Deinococcus betulae]